MIKFLKKWKRERIRRKVYKLNVKAAKYLKLSEAATKNAEFIKIQIDFFCLNSGFISETKSWQHNYSNCISKSAKYKALYDNCQDQISLLTSQAIEISVKK